MSEDDLLRYICSTFNYRVDIDAREFQETAPLQLLDKDVYSVCIKPILTPVFKDNQNIYNELTIKAFDEWSNALHNRIVFKEVSNEKDADIKVFFLAASKTKLGKQYQEQIIAGCVNGIFYFLKGKICIAIGIRDIFNEKFDYDKVYQILLHEIGHILCLGHSPNPEDIMCGTASDSCKGMTLNDIFVLRLIYHIGSGKSYEEMKDYIQDCVYDFVNYTYKQNKAKELLKFVSSPKKDIILPQKCGENKLMNDLLSISELKKYKMIVDNIKIEKIPELI